MGQGFAQGATGMTCLRYVWGLSWENDSDKGLKSPGLAPEPNDLKAGLTQPGTDNGSTCTWPFCVAEATASMVTGSLVEVFGE